MKLILITVFFLSIVGCSKKKVYIIKQWHLSPSTNTSDIEKSKKLPQYINQIDIYDRVLSLVNEKKSGVVIAEGCETNSEYLKTNFNGWNLELLEQRKIIGDLDEILAPVPLKIKAKLNDEISVVCGDNLKLIQENNLAFSDLNGFSGFFERLKYYKQNDEKKYQKYLKAFKETTDFNSKEDPVLVAKNKTLSSLNKFRLYIEKRNLSFLDAIKKNLDENPIVVIGGLHVSNLVESLEKLDIEYEVITPSKYPAQDEQLVGKLQVSLNSYGEKKLLFFQVPSGFNSQKFPIKNLISSNQLALKTEIEDLKEIVLSHEEKFELLLSDFDMDGVRDFTLSSAGNTTVISAEDNDWDNDGVPNLLDSSIGDTEIFLVNKVTSNQQLSNHYDTKGVDTKSIFEILTNYKISLVEDSEVKHDILLLKVFVEVLQKSKLKAGDILTVVATKPKVQYGKKVFFSYIKQSKSLELYPEELFKFLAIKKKKEYSTVAFKKYLDGVIIPILIHSFAHEMGHAEELDSFSLAKKLGWEWKETKINSKYLVSHRNRNKHLNKVLNNIRFRGLSYSSWLKEHQLYLNKVNDLVKNYKDDKEFIQQAQDLKWFKKIENKGKEFQVSFLVSQKIPSLYSLSSLIEWNAEIYAACIFQKFYPKSSQRSESIRYELLMGFNPGVVNSKTCQ